MPPSCQVLRSIESQKEFIHTFRCHLYIGVPTTVAAAIAGFSAVKGYPILSATLAIVAATASAVFTFLNPKERAARHLGAGNDYKALHNDARIFSEIDCQQGLSPAHLADRLRDINGRRNKLNIESPQIPRMAFERAKTGIEAGEALYKVDDDRSQPGN